MCEAGTLHCEMPAIERTLLTCGCLLLSACTAVVDSQPMPGAAGSAGSAGSSASDPAATEACNTASLIPARVRKITDRQYGRLVQELLPAVSVSPIATPGTELALIQDEAKFVVRGPLAAQYWDGAFALAKQALALPGLVPCSSVPVEVAARRACAAQLIETLGPRVFRRPLTAADSEPLLAVYDTGAETSFEKGVELVMAALLQSADFLYRTELGDAAQAGPELMLTPYEVASLLSFLFLGGAPDAELWAAASSGSLASEQGVAEQVTRLLQLPAAQAQVTELVSGVLGADGALTSSREPAAFPELTPQLRQAMADEVTHFVQDNLFSGKPLAELFTSRSAKVDDTLAAFYGLSPVGQPSVVELPAAQRSGILTRAGTVLSLPTGSRAVHRGLFLAHNYLCRVLAPPPASLQAEINQTIALGLNERQLAELRASKATCAGCHAMFDGLGLAYEHYDFIGKYLTERDGAPVDAHGELNHSDVDGSFANLLELSEILARSRDVALCLPERLSEQALGLTFEDGEKCSVEQLVSPWASGDRKLGELIPQLAKSRFFLQRNRVN
jgi:hypothetical protein